MKKSIVYLFALVLIVSACSSSNKSEDKEEKYVAIAYSFNNILPDPTYLTHINYAFGHVNETLNGVRLNSDERLREIVALKEQKPTLKVLVSIGGWGSGGFSEMASNRALREAFAADCKRLVDEFNLDGIDLDWEYPTHSWAPGVASSPDDYDNYTLLSMNIRREIGNDKLLTMATLADADPIIDYRAIEPYYDFFNIMTYDLAFLRPTDPHHQGALYRSELVNRISCEEAVDKHVAAGIPIEKLVLGILFGGRGQRMNVNDLPEGHTRQWDDVAKASYITNAAGEFVYSFECTRAIEYKCEFVKNRGMLGAMYWSYGNEELRDAVYNGLMSIKK